MRRNILEITLERSKWLSVQPGQFCDILSSMPLGYLSLGDTVRAKTTGGEYWDGAIIDVHQGLDTLWRIRCVRAHHGGAVSGVYPGAAISQDETNAMLAKALRRGGGAP